MKNYLFKKTPHYTSIKHENNNDYPSYTIEYLNKNTIVKKTITVKHNEDNDFLSTEHENIDSYLQNFYKINGMSSLFSASICGFLVNIQNEMKIKGNILEIGVYEGRFFIMLALGLLKSEIALAIDTFPRDRISIFFNNCMEYNIANYEIINKSSMDINHEDIKLKSKNNLLYRIIHIDGDHSSYAVMNDLELSKNILHPCGIIIIDDIFSPLYPELTFSVYEWLKTNVDFCILCIIDKINITESSKIILCKKDAKDLYEEKILIKFSNYIFHNPDTIIISKTVPYIIEEK